MPAPGSGIRSGDHDGWLYPERVRALALLAATAVAIVLCYLLVRPFLPALAWALAFAVVAHPLHEWTERRLGRPNLTAGLAVLMVALVLVVPTIFVTHQVFAEVSRSVDAIRPGANGGEWLAALRKNPPIARLLDVLGSVVDLRQEFERLGTAAAAGAKSLVAGSVWGLVQLLVALFVLFYFFRDRPLVLRALRSLVPLSDSETDEIFRRVEDTVYATIFGTVAVALVQGTLGGLIFWAFGLPAPLLWGLVMFVVSVVPVLGAFVVWGPVAAYLALQGEWVKAIILTAWGSVVIGLIDNLLYPILVGHRLRLHTVPVFFAIVGGLVVFGASGIVVGPVILAVTMALWDVWCRRITRGGPAEVEPSPKLRPSGSGAGR
jgi:predicted PurR-regulated permease PerM